MVVFPRFHSMKCFFCAALGSTLLFGLPIAARAQARGTHYFVRSEPLALRGTLRAGGKGFLVEAPLIVADNGVREVMATPNGARLIVLRQTYRPSAEALLTPGSNSTFGPQIVPGEASVTVWNTFTQKGTVVWRQRIAPGETFYFRNRGNSARPKRRPYFGICRRGKAEPRKRPANGRPGDGQHFIGGHGKNRGAADKRVAAGLRNDGRSPVWPPQSVADFALCGVDSPLSIRGRNRSGFCGPTAR